MSKRAEIEKSVWQFSTGDFAVLEQIFLKSWSTRIMQRLCA
jgi:hypothetical protein